MAQDFGTPLPPEAPAPAKKNNTVLIIVIVVAVVLLLCCCCAIASYFGYNYIYNQTYYY
jgi:flagellar basal body-associated protein FliL